MRISDWSSDVCSSDLPPNDTLLSGAGQAGARASALAGLEARVGLVDDVDPALATDHAAIPMAGLGRLQRIHDLHDTNLSRAPPAGNRHGRSRRQQKTERSVARPDEKRPEERRVGERGGDTGDFGWAADP